MSHTQRSYLVERPPHIDWTALNDLINHIRDGLHEVWVGKLKDTHFHDIMSILQEPVKLKG